MKKILIRTLGGKKIGYGHFYRCLSLAKALKTIEKEIRIIFLINDELVEEIKNTLFEYQLSNNLTDDFSIVSNIEIDLFVFDSYLGNNNYLKKIKNKTKLLLIDDNNNLYDNSIPDIIYNGNIYATQLGYPKKQQQLQLFGSRFLLMKKEYWSDNEMNLDKEGVLFTTGGSDSNRVMVEFLKVMKDIDIKTKLIIGPGYSEDYIRRIEELSFENVELIYKPKSLKQYIRTAEVVVTAGGSTVYEVLSQKSTPIVYSVADNQDLISTTLKNMGVEYIGKYPNIDFGRLKLLLISKSDNKLNHKSKLSITVTGKGALLVAKRILEVL